MGQGSGIAEVAGQEVRAVEIAATGTALAQAARLRGVYIQPGTGGAITLRDGGAGGAVKLPLTAGAVDHGVYIPLPDGGIQFDTDIHATLVIGVGAITLFYR